MTSATDYGERTRKAINEIMARKDGAMTDNRTTELLPCPFCGGEADVMLTQGRYGQSYSIHHESHGNCAAKYVNTVNFHTEAEAIEAWNTRHERTCKLVWGESMSSTYRECSECGVYLGDVPIKITNYCPNCGAKVIKVVDNADK